MDILNIKGRAKVVRTKFGFNASGANNVHLVGDFNNWNINTNPMEKGENGYFYTELDLDFGKHMYKFLVDNKWNNDPAADEYQYDEIGCENSVKIVS